MNISFEFSLSSLNCNTDDWFCDVVDRSDVLIRDDHRTGRGRTRIMIHIVDQLDMREIVLLLLMMFIYERN